MSSDIEHQEFFTLEEAIKLSQKEIKPIFSKPKCTSKLLAKPPFRFLHDIITATLKSSYGFPKNYFPEKELSSDFFKDKESKIKFLDKLIFLTRFCFERTRSRNQDNLVASLKKVRSSKIVAGLEPIHTNVLLVCFACVAKAADSHKSLVEECAKEYTKQKQLKQSLKAKAKGKDTDGTEYNGQSPAKTPLISSAKKTKTKKMKKSMTTTPPSAKPLAPPSSHDNKSNKTLLTKKIKACNSDLQQTRESLISLGITKPHCSDKLLKKPPFRFLHDLIMAVGRKTGFGMDIYSDFEKESSNVSKTKSSKIQFLEKIISLTKTILLDLEFEIKPAKIVSGLESDKTCKFLQLLTVAAEVSIERASEVTTQEESSSVGAAAGGGEVILSALGDVSNQGVVDKEENDILHSSSAEGVSTDNTQKEYVVEGEKEDRIERNVHARIDPKDSSPVIQEEKAPTNDTDIVDNNGEDDVEETIPSLPPSTTTTTKPDGNENSDMVVKESASDDGVSPSRPAQVDIVEEHPQEMNIDEELQLLEKTRQMIEKDLGIQKPQCSDKLLRKPPTRFLYDLFMAIENQANGFLDSILTSEEKQSYEYVKDKKVDFLEKIVQFVYYGGNDRDNTGGIVQATKVVSGKESVKKMCKFLQDLATKALKFQSKVADAINVQKATEKEEEVGKTPVSQHHTVTFLDDVQSHEQEEERFDHANDLIDSPPSSMEDDDDIDEEDFQAFLMSQDIQAKTTMNNLRPTTAKRRPPRTLSQQLGEKDRPVVEDRRRRRRVKQVELNDDYMNQSTSGNNDENSMNNRADGPIGIIPESESDDEEVYHSNDAKIPRKVITKRKTPQDNSVESMMNIIQKSVQSSITPLGKCMDRIINQKNFVRDIEQERESITHKYLSTKEKMDKIDRRNNKIYIEPLYVTLRDLEEQILETKRAIVEKKLAIHKNDEQINRILGAMSMGGCE